MLGIQLAPLARAADCVTKFLGDGRRAALRNAARRGAGGGKSHWNRFPSFLQRERRCRRNEVWNGLLRNCNPCRVAPEKAAGRELRHFRSGPRRRPASPDCAHVLATSLTASRQIFLSLPRAQLRQGRAGNQREYREYGDRALQLI